MNSHDEPTPQTGDGADDGRDNKYARTLMPVVSIIFAVGAVYNILLGRWAAAALHVATALLFTFGRNIDTWPKPKRYAVVAVYLLLALAMLFEIYLDVRKYW